MEATIAARVAAGFDEAMAACILRFYRAAQHGGFEAAAARPGLVSLATADTDTQRREAPRWPGLVWWSSKAPGTGG